MNDQARSLRGTAFAPSKQPAEPRVRTLALLAATGGVGTTSIAVNLAVVLVGRHRRVCLFDADSARYDVADLAGLPDSALPLERLSARPDWFHHVPRTPDGVQIASATQFLAPDRQRSCAAAAQLATHITHSARGFDLLIIDVGCQTMPVMEAWAAAVDRVLLVTSQETVAILNCYAVLKHLAIAEVAADIGIVLNQVFDADDAATSEARLEESTRRFLGRPVRVAGQIPFDVRLRDGGAAGRPIAMASPNAPAVTAIEQLADLFSAGAGRAMGTSHPPQASPLVLPNSGNHSRVSGPLADDGKPTLEREFAR